MPTKLSEILDEMSAKERERKKARVRGIVIKKKLTKKGNIYLVLRLPKDEIAAVVNKNKTDLFKIAEKIKLNDEIYVEGERSVDTVWCDKLEIIRKSSGQMKLEF